MKKFLITIAAVIVVLAIGLTVLIKLYITPERVRGFIIPTAEASLNRKVDIGDISISLVKGIGVNNFVIKEADGKSDFVKFNEFVLKFKLLPLLSRNVVIDEVKVASPEINIKRSKDGTFNFESIGKKKDKDKDVKKENGVDEAEGLPVALLVRAISVQNARFSLTDALNELPDIKSSTDFDISIKSLDGSNLSTQGNIKIKADELVLKKPVKKTVKDITAAIQYGLTFNLESLDIHIDRADVNINEIAAAITGDAKKLKTSPEVDLAITIPKVKTAALQKLAALFSDMQGLNLSGSIEADMKVRGAIKKPDSLKAKGNISLDKVGILYREVEALLDGAVQFDEEVMNINLVSTVDKNTAEIKGSVRNYMKNQDINLNIYSQKLFLEQVMLPLPAGKGDAGGTGQKPGEAPRKGPDKEGEPLNLKLTARGEIKVDSAVYKGMTMSDFYMEYQFRNNKLEISPVSAKVGKGEIKLNAAADLSMPGYRYGLSSTLSSIHAEEFVNAFFPKAANTVFGRLSADVKANGAGTVPASIKNNLVGNGEFRIEDGKITDANLTRELARFLNVPELKSIDLDEAKGTIVVKNGIASLNSIFSSKDISLDPQGTIGLDESLAIAFDLKLSPPLTDKAMTSTVTKYIKNDEGWGIIPLKVGGTFAKPSYTVDIEKAGKRAVKKETDKYIDKLFDTKDEEKKKELEPVKDILKGLFK